MKVTRVRAISFWFRAPAARAGSALTGAEG